MKKLYSILTVLALSFLGASSAWACHYSSFTLVSHTDLGGGLHEYTVTFTTGTGYDGAVGRTDLWAVMLAGGATFHSYPATLTSPVTSAVFGADNYSYGPEILLYDAISWPSNSPYYYASSWTCTQSNCGAPAPVSVTFTYVTNGAPTSMTLMGAEAYGVGVPPYGCNGNPEMVINLNGPVVDAGPNAQFCTGGCATLTGSATGGTPPYTYLWSNGATTPTITVCPTTNQLYNLVVTDNNGYSSSDYVSVTVFNLPTVSAGADKTIYDGYGATCATLNGYANGSMYPYTYHWSNNANTINTSVCPNNTTNYTLTVTDGRGCIASDVATVNVIDISCGRNKVRMCRNNRNYCVSTSQVSGKLNQGYTLGSCGSNKTGDEEVFEEVYMSGNVVNIYPNPSNEQFTVNYSFNADENVSIEVYNIAGAKVQNVIVDKPVMGGEENVENVSVIDYPAGVYFVSVTTRNGERTMHKMLVAH